MKSCDYVNIVIIIFKPSINKAIDPLITFNPGLISKAVKTYFDRKAVKTRLKPVKTGLNRSKHGQNLKLRNTCQGL